jgi:hypothetical protein
MARQECRLVLMLLAVSMMLPVPRAGADIGDQVSFYKGDNAEGYLRPLVDAIGADLNNGLFQSSFIPISGLSAAFELHGMAVWFGNDDRTFTAKTGEGFQPPSSARASTVVGPEDAASVSGEGGTTYMFPGGFNLNSFALSVPQIRFGSYRGTEGILRYLGADLGDSDLGNLSLFGFGLRHNISQYFGPDFPVSMAGGFLWQRFKAGKNDAGGDMLRSTDWTIGVQAGRIYGSGWATIEPYTGLSLDGHSMDVAYTGKDDEDSTIRLSYEPTHSLRFTLGFLAKLAVAGVHAEYSIGKRNSFAFGLALGKL